MNFEEAYKKLREGTATDAEAAFVARELENVRRISSILDDPALSDPGISKAKLETVQKARKAFNHKALIRTVVIVLCSLLIIAAVVCSILFIPSNISASGKVKLTKEQAVEAAYACLVKEVGEKQAEDSRDGRHRLRIPAENIFGHGTDSACGPTPMTGGKHGAGSSLLWRRKRKIDGSSGTGTAYGRLRQAGGDLPFFEK